MAQEHCSNSALIDAQSMGLAQKEWKQFQKVHNYGGPAACQSDKDTFLVMRCSQFAACPPAVKASYECDLDHAAAAGRNLLTEKYAYMMRDTAPVEYAELAGQLPTISPEKEKLIKGIVAYVLNWSAEMQDKYPWLMATSRPVHTVQDSLGTSIETYTWGELSTYSERTLSLLLEHYQAMADREINIHEVTLGITVRLYGYDSLEQAEETAEKRLSERLC